MEFKFEPIKIGVMKHGSNPGLSIDATIYNKCNDFYGLRIAITLQSFRKCLFIAVIPFGQIRFSSNK